MKLAICDDEPKIQLHSIAQMLERYVTPEGKKGSSTISMEMPWILCQTFPLADMMHSDGYSDAGLNSIEAARDIQSDPMKGSRFCFDASPNLPWTVTGFMH